MVDFIQKLKSKGIELEYLNIGGGLGIIYEEEKPQTAEIFAKNVLPLLKPTGLKIILEPGRFIVGPAGVLVVKVLYIKKTLKKRFVIVDGGMNDLIRPALYGAYHKILPARLENGSFKSERVDVVGPICESADFFAKDRFLPKVKEGDFLVIMGTGAYGFSMSSNYNFRPRCAEVMVRKNRAFIIRKRETYEQLIENMVIPHFLKR
jgi:diaminopimelate decarboxylase